MGDGSEDDGGYDSELTVSSSDASESDGDNYLPSATTSPTAVQIPSITGLSRLPPAGDEPSSAADRPMTARGPVPGANAARLARLSPSGAQTARPSGDVSPSDVPLSSLSLHSRTNGIVPASPSSLRKDPGSAPRLDLAAAAGGDMAVRSPHSGRSSGRLRSDRSARNAVALSLDLISPAFALDKESLRRGEASGVCAPDIARQRAAVGLGVPAAALRLYELREIQPGAQMSEGTHRIAFSIADTSFSLAAVEETMAENKRLMATNSHTSQALETLQQLVKEQNQALAKLKVQASEQAANARRLQERSDTSDRFASMLRQQLEHSENLRIQGQRSLAELKREFDALTAELAAEGHPVAAPISGPAASQQLALAGPQYGAHSPAAVMPSSPAGDRLAALLERFSDESVLSRLESCLERIAPSNCS